MGFRYGGLFVLQIQLAKRVDALPVTRNYVIEGEAATPWQSDRQRQAG